MGGTDIRLTVFGARGSIAVGGSEYNEFGGSTSCYMVQAEQETVILDAGSGLLHAPTEFAKPPVIVLSHWHVDHLVGLGMYGRLAQAGAITRLFGPAGDDDEAAARLRGMYAPPYWPLELTEYAGDLRVHAMPAALRVGPLLIEAMEGNHPGGCLVYRLSYGNKSVVYATDYEHEPASFMRLADFAQDADLLLYDAQYCNKNHARYRGFGHSTDGKGVELMRLSHAKRLLLIHHDPQSTDEALRRREERLSCDGARFAREGEVIVL
ncbi:MAG: MBL fold metallo-hydrolase [Coriobacteriales bacterium]|nr:MBL fold metallo-hydrolase [Coriobacteriales bacterium]